MRTRPPDLDDADVAAAVAAGWALSVRSATHAPVGFGSHHWVVVDGSDRRWFATVDDVGPSGRFTRARLGAALATSRALHGRGLEVVVAPRPTVAGDLLVDVGPDRVLALYPYVDGTCHGWGPFEPSQRAAVLRALAALHTTSVPDAPPPPEDVGLQDRDVLGAALDDLERPWGTGPLAEPVRSLLAEHDGAVRRRLAAHDRDAAAIGASARVVVTHGEPHRGNVVETAAGLRLVDWDTTSAAPPERDLWWVLRDDPGLAADWSARTGMDVDAGLLALYEERWDLADLAADVAAFRRPHRDDADTRLARSVLGRIVEATAQRFG